MISSRRQAHSKIVEALGEKFSVENADGNFSSGHLVLGSLILLRVARVTPANPTQ